MKCGGKVNIWEVKKGRCWEGAESWGVVWTENLKLVLGRATREPTQHLIWDRDHGKLWSSWPVWMVEWPLALMVYQLASVALPSGRVCVEIWAASSSCIGQPLTARPTQLYTRLLHITAYWRRKCAVFVWPALALFTNVYRKYSVDSQPKPVQFLPLCLTSYQTLSFASRS
jgi:hypothetical protein